MSHDSAIFQVKDKCISLVEINLIIQKRKSNEKLFNGQENPDNPV
jgi:hypothetical protein